MPISEYPENVKILFNVREAAEMLGVSQVTIRREVAAGRLHHARIGTRVLFHLTDLEAFAANCRISAEGSRAKGAR